MKSTVPSFSVPLKKYYSSDLLAPSPGLAGHKTGWGCEGGDGAVGILLEEAELVS